jgi:transglutaminase-like putative cysteine protease
MDHIEQAEPRSRQQGALRLPWPLVGACATAFVAHAFTAQEFILMPVLALLLILSQLVSWRLPENRSISRGIRLVLLTAVLVIIGWPEDAIWGWYVKPEYTNLIGAIIAVEIVVRCWEFKPPARTTIMLLSMLVFACASDIGTRSLIPWFAVVFATFIVISLRSLTPRIRPMRDARRFPIGRMLCGLLAIGISFSGVGSLNYYRRELAVWGMQFFREPKSGASDIGLNAAPQLGSTFNPSPSMQRILLINGPHAERYLRVLAFDTLVGSRWFPLLQERPRRGVSAARLSGRATTQPARMQTLSVRVIGDTFDVLPLPLNVASVVSSSDLLQDELGSLITARTQTDLRYELQLPADEHFAGPVNLPLGTETDLRRKAALDLPERLDPRIIQLAREVAGEGDARLRILRIAQNLQSTHEYSLSYEPQGSDALADFILNQRAAHCEYFASAMVIMSRAIGVPARLVTGYYAHESAGTNRMVVRDRDAHAWAECWIDGVGWITVDATPSGGKPDARFADASALRRAWETIQDLPATVRDWLGSLSRKSVFTTLFVCAVLILISGIVQILRRKRTTHDLPYVAPHNPALMLTARRFETWLRSQRKGDRCDPTRTWRDHIRALGEPPRCVRFLDLYDEARFGGANGETISKLTGMMDELENNTNGK